MVTNPKLSFFKREKENWKKGMHLKRDSYCDAQALYDDDAASSTLDDFDDAVVVGLEKVVVVVVVVVVSIPVGKRRSRLLRFEALL